MTTAHILSKLQHLDEELTRIASRLTQLQALVLDMSANIWQAGDNERPACGEESESRRAG